VNAVIIIVQLAVCLTDSQLDDDADRVLKRDDRIDKIERSDMLALLGAIHASFLYRFYATK